ncbi:unnamed protein product [Caenorhabditis sp. 36 PRJEB53466]|nr:unnamed protein product [Caenorhabditis sp. 36 PRJEB53466]
MAHDRLLQYSTATTSILTNFLLIYLISYKSPEHIGNYKYLLIFISAFEMLYGVLDIIASPLSFSYGPTFIIIVPHKETVFGADVAMFLNILYCSFFGFSMGMFVIIFAYRLLASTGSNLLTYFPGVRIIFWFVYPLFHGIVWGVSTAFPLAPSRAMDDFIRESITEKFNMSLDDVAYTGMLFFSYEDNKRIIHHNSVLATLVQWTLTTLSLLMVIVFGFKCYYRINALLKVQAQMSGVMRETQTQLFVALVVQALIPLILMHIPVLALYTCSLLNIDMDATFVCVTISLFPALDPFPTLIIIKSYREATLDLLKSALRIKRFTPKFKISQTASPS